MTIKIQITWLTFCLIKKITWLTWNSQCPDQFFLTVISSMKFNVNDISVDLCLYCIFFYNSWYYYVYVWNHRATMILLTLVKNCCGSMWSYSKIKHAISTQIPFTCIVWFQTFFLSSVHVTWHCLCVEDELHVFSNSILTFFRCVFYIRWKRKKRHHKI